MKIQQLKSLLEQELGIQVYLHHTTAKDKKTIKTPYIVLVVFGSDNDFADNIVYKKKLNVSLILHSYTNREETEEEIEDILEENMIGWEKDLDWDDEIMLYTTQYDFVI